jgi:hypothetical protein
MPRIAEADIEQIKRFTNLLTLVPSRGIDLEKPGSMMPIKIKRLWYVSQQ